MKQMMKLGVTTALVLTGGVVAEAEEVSVEVKAEGVTAENHVTAEVKAEDLTLAKTKQEEAQNNVAAQEKRVENLTQEVGQAEADLADAQEEVAHRKQLADEATPETIEKAKEAISQAEETVTTAKSKLEESQANKAEADEAVENQEKVVATHEATVSEKQEAVISAQKDVDTAQAILDGTGQAQVIQEAEDAASHLAQTQADLQTAQDSLVQAQEADQKRLEAIAEAESKLEDASKKLEVLTQSVENASRKLAETTQTLETATQAFTVAENDVNGINTIVLSDEYIQALRDYVFNYTEKGTEATQTLNALSEQLKKEHVFKANLNDDKTVYATNDLPEEVLQELSLFASDLVNQIRKQLGTSETVVTQDVVRFADLVTDGYVSDNWSWQDINETGHDAKAVNEAARTLGLQVSSPADEAIGHQLYENMNSYRTVLPQVTLSEAKRRIYNSLVNFFFNGYEYLHAESISGLKSSGTEYLGVDLSLRSNVLGVHFLTVSDSKIEAGSSFDTTAIENTRTVEAIQAAYAVAQDTLTQATTAHQKAQEDKAATLKLKTTAEVANQEAITVLSNAKAVPVQVPSAQAVVDNAEKAVQKAEERNTKALEALASLQADVKEKQAKLAEAKAVLEEKVAELTQAQSDLNAVQTVLDELKASQATAQEKVAEAEENVAKAEETLELAKTYLSDLEQAPEKLAEAKDKLAVAQTILAEKQAELQAEKALLEELQAQVGQAEQEYQRLLAAYEKAQEAQRQAELAKQYEAIVKAGGLPIALVDETGRITGYVAQKQEASTSATQKTVQASTQLPKTGSTQSALSLVGLLISSLTLFGTSGKRFKKR